MSSLTGIIFGRPRRVEVGEDGAGAVIFDASVVENHSQNATVTKYPVETGSDIADHIRVEPLSFTMTGAVSNTPIIPLASLTAQGDRRAENAFEKLRELQEKGALLTVTTTLRTYKNMVLTAISVPRDASRGNIVEAALTFEEMVTAKADLVAAREAADPARAPQTDAGTNSPNAATPAQAAKAKTVAVDTAATTVLGGIGRTLGLGP